MNNSVANKINLLLVIVITLSPLLSYFVVNLFNIKSGIYFFNMVVFGAFIYMMLNCIKKGRIRFPIYLSFLLAFSVYVILSDIFIAGRSFTPTYLFKHQIMMGFFAATIIENTLFSRKYIYELTRLVKWLFWLSIAVILIQQFVNPMFMLNSNALEEFAASSDLEKRFSSIYSYFGGSLYAGLTVIPLLCIIVAENTKKNGTISIYYLAATIFSVINKSRWIIINVAISLFVKYNLKKMNLKQGIRVIGTIIVMSMSSYYVLKYFNFDIDGLIADRFLETSQGGLENGAASSRLLAFEVFGNLYPEYPVLGKGNLQWGEGAEGDLELSTMLRGRSSQIHVGYLSLFYWYGMAGALLFLAFLFFMLKKMKATARRWDYWGPYWGMMGFVFANLTLVHLNINVPGLILCLVYNKYYEQRRIVFLKEEEQSVEEVLTEAVP
ncbi:MAG: hypothetical protein H7Y03_13470 [Chitinophagaceae bacterium]|nr:hypothetical protein [Chitinophagaceae bacterium]